MPYISFGFFLGGGVSSIFSVKGNDDDLNRLNIKCEEHDFTIKLISFSQTIRTV